MSQSEPTKKRRRRKDKLDVRLADVQTPVFLLSADRKLVFFNTGCEQLTGWTANDVLGLVCDYTSDGDRTQVESLTGSLCPPPEVLAGRQRTVPAYFAHPQGQSIARAIHFYPLASEPGTVDCFLGIILPIEQPVKSPAASSVHQLHAELAALKAMLRTKFGLKSLVCRGSAMRRVIEQFHIALATNAPVLFHGGTGTGKEHLARAVHNESESRSRSFVPLDCSKLSVLELTQTLKRVLNAQTDDSATIPALRPGSLFLQNVECLPRDLQSLLLESFQKADKKSRGELRLMAATTCDLREAIDDDRLDAGLYYLLTALQIELPPLKDRREDLPLLAQHFLESRNRHSGKQIGGFAGDVWEQLEQYNWPGNLDELQAVVQEAYVACEGELIRPEHLPFRFRTGLDAQAVGPIIRPKPVLLEPLLQQVETEQIQLALAEAKNNKSKAAELLGLTRTRLYRRMQALGVEDLE